MPSRALHPADSTPWPACNTAAALLPLLLLMPCTSPTRLQPIWASRTLQGGRDHIIAAEVAVPAGLGFATFQGLALAHDFPERQKLPPGTAWEHQACQLT